MCERGVIEAQRTCKARAVNVLYTVVRHEEALLPAHKHVGHINVIKSFRETAEPVPQRPEGGKP